jgi:hypothetical protein
LHLQAIGNLEKLRSVTNILMCNLTHVSTLESKKIGIKNFDLWAENSLWNKKIRIDYMNKAKQDQNTWNKIGFVVSSSPSPEGDVDSNLIVAKVVTSNEGKGGKGKGKRPNWPNLNLIFWLFVWLLFFQKFYHYIQVSIIKT